MAASFGTVVIMHYKQISCNASTYGSEEMDESNMKLNEKLLGTFDEIPPIVMALLGGFLQQMFGPKKMLILSALPGILSWLLIVLASESVTSLLLSRACAGVAYGLLIGNVYLPNTVSNKNLGSFKMIEVCFNIF